MADICKSLRSMPSSLNDACRTMEAAAGQIEVLVKALTELSQMYASTWDRVDGSLVMFDKGIERFEEAHHAAQVALAVVNGTPLPGVDADDDETSVLWDNSNMTDIVKKLRTSQSSNIMDLEAAAEIERLRDIARRVAELPYFKNAGVEALVRDAKDALAISPTNRGDKP